MANTQLGDDQQVAYTLTELDSQGLPANIQVGDFVSFSSSDPSSLQVVPDATPAAGSVASGFLVGVKPAAGIIVTATVQHAVPGNGGPFVITDTIDVVGGQVSTLAINLGAPTLKSPPAQTPPPTGP